MKNVRLTTTFALPVALATLAACSGSPGESAGVASSAEAVSTEASGARGAVFTIDNAAAGNDVLAFSRAADGTLTAAGTYPTGGLGTDVGLGTQGAVTLALGGKLLLAVNAGSNDVSTFTVSGSKLALVSRVASGGTAPCSIAVHDHVVYVLNGGTPNNVSGFHLSDAGELTPIANSTRPLSGDAVSPAQVGFSRTARSWRSRRRAPTTSTPS